MNNPGASMGNGPSASAFADVEGVETDKFELEGRDVKVPRPEDMQDLLKGSVSLSEVTRRLESKYPGYTLPDAAFIQKLLGDKQKNLDKLKAKMSFGGQYFNFLYTDDEGNVARSDRYDEKDSKIAMGSNERDITKVQDYDNIFLVKKLEGAGGSIN